MCMYWFIVFPFCCNKWEMWDISLHWLGFEMATKHRMWMDRTWQMTHEMSLWKNNIWGYESDMKQCGSVPKLGDFEDLRCRSNACSSRCQDQKVGWNSPGSLPPDEKTGSRQEFFRRQQCQESSGWGYQHDAPWLPPHDSLVDSRSSCLIT